MALPSQRKTKRYNRKSIAWTAPLHCLLLAGYDDNHYIFNDPLRTQVPTDYMVMRYFSLNIRIIQKLDLKEFRLKRAYWPLLETSF